MKHSIKKRIILISISFTLIMGLLTAFISYSLFYHYNKDNLTRSTELNIQHITEAINEKTDSINLLVRWCQINMRSLPYQLYGDNSGNSRRELYDRLYDQYSSVEYTRYIQRLVVSNFSDYYIQIVPTAYSTTADVPEVIMGQDYFYPALESDDWDLSMGFVEDPLLRSSKQVLPVIRPIYHPYNSSMLGWVLVELQPDIFCDALEAYSLDSDSSFYVTIADNVYAYADGALTLLDEPLWDTADTGQALLYTDTAVYASTNGSTRYVTRPLSLSGCYVTQSIPSTRFFAQMPSFLYMLIFITLLVILAGLLYTMYLNRLVNRPIEKILTRIKLISSGDFGRDASIEWDNEFGEIGRGINELSGSVQSLIDNRIKIENEKREYEYRMLQSQINPHFLYNTLNSIKWMASIQHATGIPEMTTALSRLLKSIAKDSRQRVPIETELSFLDDYYTIQKYRYGGGITMEVELEEQSLAANEILRFTLQPIVENAIFHGIEPKGGVGTIKIHIARQGSDVCIDVTDNGVGMDADTLAGLLDGEEQNRSNFFRDIGISNVHRRLRYEYGEAYGLSFTSEPGVYTTVRVMLPGKIYTDTENS